MFRSASRGFAVLPVIGLLAALAVTAIALQSFTPMPTGNQPQQAAGAILAADIPPPRTQAMPSTGGVPYLLPAPAATPAATATAPPPDAKAKADAEATAKAEADAKAKVDEEILNKCGIAIATAKTAATTKVAAKPTDPNSDDCVAAAPDPAKPGNFKCVGKSATVTVKPDGTLKIKAEPNPKVSPGTCKTTACVDTTTSYSPISSVMRCVPIISKGINKALVVDKLSSDGFTVRKNFLTGKWEPSCLVGCGIDQTQQDIINSAFGKDPTNSTNEMLVDSDGTLKAPDGVKIKEIAAYSPDPDADKDSKDVDTAIADACKRDSPPEWCTSPTPLTPPERPVVSGGITSETTKTDISRIEDNKWEARPANEAERKYIESLGFKCDASGLCTKGSSEAPPGTICRDRTAPPCKPGNEPPKQCANGGDPANGCKIQSVCSNGGNPPDCRINSTFQQPQQQQQPPRPPASSGGGNPMSSMMNSIGKALGLNQPPPPQPLPPPQQCPSDPQAYAQWQQQYQQQLQQYNFQLQQYQYQQQQQQQQQQYQQQLNQYYAQQGYAPQAPVQQQQITAPPQQPQQCTPSTGNQCQLQLQQTPPAANCSVGQWQPVMNGQCVTNWQCVPNPTNTNFTANPTSGPAPLTVTFTGMVPVPSTIDFGDGTNFVGSGCGAATCPPANLTKTHTYAAAGPYQVQLTSNGNVISSITITVTSGTATSTPPTPPLVPLRAELSCQPQLADVGMMVAFAYSCSVGTSKGSGFDTAGAQSGVASTTIGSPPAGANTATYALTCTDQGRTAGAQCSVQVNKPSTILVANPKTVASGKTALLGWVTTGMQSCVISSPDQADFTAANSYNTSVSGTAVTSPVFSQATFLLHCQTLAGGTKDATVVVTSQ
ncbi:hypothetical protein A2851_05025 [Candidatus Kaiserbacteria bacterium RIFCSPHIGHO2_01_FULL_53_29]|uniref:PKD domain-containing protein n=1 Tax=Candidatus Kaiserbacteria bacterium RIFCSPHIGHO2_01_FULL_53_29 TaxID=1798480 RepID=A0A1F6CTA7_9BACT|nr:MAG: hypothetical protein A2851_05025 [Candidatus Kaiserbacteria bacterium RIFCSPHIGHO2_01_FULL_53_29]